MPNVSVRGACSADGCERPHYAHGLCKACLRRKNRSGSTARQRIERGSTQRCKEPGCDRRANVRGYCPHHDDKVRRHGTTEGRPACREPGCEKRPYGGQEFCRDHRRTNGLVDHPRRTGERIGACRFCGEDFVQKRKPGKPLAYCSRPECLEARRETRRRKSLAAYYGETEPRERTRKNWREILPSEILVLPSFHPLYRSARYKARQGSVFIVCANPICPRKGEPFERPYKLGQPVKYCSDECRTAINRLRARHHRLVRRKSKQIGDVFSLDFLYERDGGVCFLCGLDVDRRDASEDHVVPLNGGGEHTLENVVLAHRSCNTRKSDLALGEFLARWPRKRELAA